MPFKLHRHLTSVIVFALSFALYAASAGITLYRSSLAPHYTYLAYSLLHGHVDLAPLPPTVYDLALFQNHWYVVSAPSPALLFMPLVALYGLTVSDIFLGVVLGAVNVVLVYHLLGRLGSHSEFHLPVSETMRRWLTLLFAAGTVHWYLASLGSVWFNAQIVAIMFLLLFTRETLGRGSGWLAGLWLSLAMAARATTVFAGVFYLVYLALTPGIIWQSWLKRLAPFAVTLGLGVVLLMGYNFSRFGSPLEFGYPYLQGATNIVDAYNRYGGFNLRYAPCNLYVSLLAPPDFLGQFSPVSGRLCNYLLPEGSLRTTNPWVAPNPLGMSVFLTTPPLLYLFWARRRNPVVIAAWAGLLAVALPVWLFHNTGSMQFGFRYVLDGAPFLIILIAAGMRGRCGWLERGLIALAIIVNFFGMIWMFRAFTGIGWVDMWRNVLATGLRL